MTDRVKVLLDPGRWTVQRPGETSAEAMNRLTAGGGEPFSMRRLTAYELACGVLLPEVSGGGGLFGDRVAAQVCGVRRDHAAQEGEAVSDEKVMVVAMVVCVLLFMYAIWQVKKEGK